LNHPLPRPIVERTMPRCSKALLVSALVAATVAGSAADPATARPGPPISAEARTTVPIRPREVAAAFWRRSYRPGDSARLRVWARARSLTFQVFACGPGRSWRTYYRSAVTRPWTRRWNFSGEPRPVRVRIRGWPSGLYFVRIETRDGRVGRAPLVVRPRRLGTARIAVVFPTNTWQAYNFRDMDRDGVADTWYADRSRHVVNLARPFVASGLPRGFRHNTLRFVRWMHRHGKTADFYADDDFLRFRSGRWLARRYALIVFQGHEEYVSPTQYNLTTAYRNRGGNLAFLSANNFFYRVTYSGNRMYGRTRWRDLGRPEAALVGVQYIGWHEEIYDREPYVVRGARTAPWLFRGTGLRNGERFGRFGIEIDARAPSSPSRTLLLARARNIFGPGKSAEMTYYRTARGAKVFAAGVLNFAHQARRPVINTMIANIFAKLEVR
jgi:hypothetical protein